MGFAVGASGARLSATSPLVQVPGLVLLTVAEGVVRFGILQWFRYPAPFGEVMAYQVLAAGPLQRLPGRGRGAGPDRRRVPARESIVVIANRRDFGQRRVVVMAAVVGVAFLVIVIQLWYLQVISGDHFREASDKNRMRVRPIAAPRGILYDRHHRPLVDNRPAFTLSLIPRELDEAGDRRSAVLGRVVVLARHSLSRAHRRGGPRSR